MISTGGTIAQSVDALRNAGARPEITVAATHGLFVGGARDKLLQAGVSRVFITDTVPQSSLNRLRIEVVSVAPLLAAALQRFMANGSISDLYRVENP